MPDKLVDEAAHEAREVLGRRLVALHDHGEAETAGVGAGGHKDHFGDHRRAGKETREGGIERERLGRDGKRERGRRTDLVKRTSPPGTNGT